MKMFLRSVFTFGILLISANAVYPCSCLHVSHRQEFRQTPVVFAGSVTNITEDTTYVPPQMKDAKISDELRARLQESINSRKRYLVTFKVDNRFKGVSGQKISLYAFSSDGLCSAPGFVEGEKYLVYAYREKNDLYAGGLCSRTGKLEDRSEEYKELRSFWFRFRTRLRI